MMFPGKLFFHFTYPLNSYEYRENQYILSILLIVIEMIIIEHGFNLGGGGHNP